MTDSARPGDCHQCGGKERRRKARGRQTKFTPDVVEIIIARRRLGTPLVYCAAAAGIGERTLHEWVSRGMDDMETGDETEYAAFYATLKQAEADGALRLLGKLWVADDWRAAAWALARCWPEHFGRQRETHPPAPTVVFSDDDPDELEIVGHPDVQEALAAYADAVARVRRDLDLPESP